jgi:hypothetical protein
VVVKKEEAVPAGNIFSFHFRWSSGRDPHIFRSETKEEEEKIKLKGGHILNDLY